MVKKVEVGYQKGDVVKFFKSLVEKLNIISEDPLNEDKDSRIRIPFFPLLWDVSQFYFLMKEFYYVKLFDNMAFIITNKDYSKIHEIFTFQFIKTDEEETGTSQNRYIFQIQEFDNEKNRDVYDQLNIYVSSFDVKIFKYLQKILSDSLGVNIGQLFILREGIANVGILGETDYINSDVVRYLKDFFDLMRKGLSKQQLQKMPVIEYSSKENRSNPIVNMFIRFGRDWANIDINKYMDYFTKIYDNTSYNLLIFNSEKRPIAICRATIDGGIIHFNPVPLHFLKKYITNESKNEIEEITKTLYNYTKVKTIAIHLQDFINILYKINDKEFSLLEFVFEIFQYIHNQPIIPDSILSSIISTLNVDNKKVLPHLKDIIIKFLEYYEKVIIATEVKVKKDWYELETILSITINNNKMVLKQIPTENCSNIYETRKRKDVIDLFDKFITQFTGEKYPLIILVRIDKFIEIFSSKNLQSMLEMNKLMQSLPSLEKVSEIINFIANNKEKPKDSQKIGLQNSEPPKSENIFGAVPSFNQFLMKGILLKVNKDKSFIEFRNSDASEEGYLGLNIDRLREIIEKNFPSFL